MKLNELLDLLKNALCLKKSGKNRQRAVLKSHLFTPLFFLLLTGCATVLDELWDDTVTAARYISRQSLAFFGFEGEESRAVATSHEIYQSTEEEYIPLRDQDLKAQYSDEAMPQSKEFPGYGRSQIPGIEGFSKPSSTLGSIFSTVYFNTDEHVLSQKEYYQTITRIATYIKNNSHMYIFVEGHADERASEAYNLALGTRRANFIRGLMIRAGANPDQIFTISYGKERPAVRGHTKEAWAKNRRAEFKIFQKKS